MTGLRKYARRAPLAAAVASTDSPAQRCEMCGTDLDDRHRHLVALDDRALRCVCRACGLLFDPAGAGGGRIRAVPERYLTDPAHPMAGEDWDLLGIPAMPVFAFLNSDLNRVVACYPSPAGTTESMLDLDGWTRLQQMYPLLRMPTADVEAIYVADGGGLLETFLVPIDACFTMAGMVRLHWRGPDGGDAVRRATATFLDGLRARSRPVRPAEA